jgi:hypothetical protein
MGGFIRLQEAFRQAGRDAVRLLHSWNDHVGAGLLLKNAPALRE